MSAKPILRAFIEGVPIPQGSARAFVVKGRAIVTSDNPKLKGWREWLRVNLRSEWASIETLKTPCSVHLTFVMPRPKSHLSVKGVKASAPTHMTSKPDLDKLVRAVLDAVTDAGVWQDDAQVVGVSAAKTWASAQERTGISVTIWEAE